MPWKESDVEKHNKGLNSKQKAQWVAVANSAREKCMSNGGNEATCAASAIREANGVVANSLMVYFKNTNSKYTVRHETHQGKDFIVIPVVMMVEGVHAGSQGPLLHTIQDLGKFPGAWDGIPIVVNHPQQDGQSVSANSPGVIDEVMVGRVYNTTVNGNRLAAEAWLDLNKLKEDFPEIYTDIKKKIPMEVSVGVFTENEDTEGEWKGENYSAIARNHRPDHLALLPGGIGACSIEDGCGLGANNKKGGNKMDVNGTVTDMETKRQGLKMSVADFYAVPRDPPSESKLPIFDSAHVRNALARFNQTQGLSAEEKASALRKIHAKAKKFGIDSSSMDNNSADDEEKDIYIQNVLANMDQGYRSKVEAAQKALNGLDNQNSSHYLHEMTDKHVIYQKRMDNMMKMYKQPYEADENDQIQLTGIPTEVRQTTDYVPVGTNSAVRTKFNNNKKGEQMAKIENCGHCMEKVIAIIQSNSTNFTLADQAWLLEQDELVLNKLLPKDIVLNQDGSVKSGTKSTGKKTAAADAEDAADGGADDSEEDANGKKKPQKNEMTLTSEQILQALSADDKAALAYGKKQLAERRATMISGIQANTSKEVWPDAVLTTMSEEMLDRIFKSVERKETPVDYSLNGGNFGQFQSNESLEEPLYPTGIEIETAKK